MHSLGINTNDFTLHIKQLCNFLHIASAVITVLTELSIALHHVQIFRELCKFKYPLIQNTFVPKKVNEEECEENIIGVSELLCNM